MTSKNRLSHQGLKKVDAQTAEALKNLFKTEVIDNNAGLYINGYFIGKTLLGKILLENEDAAGIVISFGLNKKIAKGGQIQLIVEPAIGHSKDDDPKIVASLRKYATTSEIGDPGPDEFLPLIKPKPPVP